MLKRKIEKTIINYLNSNSNKIMIIDGARQIGKSFIIRYVAITIRNIFLIDVTTLILKGYVSKRC